MRTTFSSRAPPPAADTDEHVVLDVGFRRPLTHSGLHRVPHADPPAGPDLSGVPQPVVGADRRVGARHRRGRHGESAPMAARLRAAVRDRQRRAGRGLDGAPHDERRRLRSVRGAHRPGSAGAVRATRRRVAATVRTDRRHRPRRPSERTGASGHAAAGDERPLRAPGRAVGRRALRDRATADGRSVGARRRRVPRRGGRRGTHARRHRRVVDLSGRGADGHE